MAIDLSRLHKLMKVSVTAEKPEASGGGDSHEPSEAEDHLEDFANALGLPHVNARTAVRALKRLLDCIDSCDEGDDTSDEEDGSDSDEG